MARPPKTLRRCCRVQPPLITMKTETEPRVRMRDVARRITTPPPLFNRCRYAALSGARERQQEAKRRAAGRARPECRPITISVLVGARAAARLHDQTRRRSVARSVVAGWGGENRKVAVCAAKLRSCRGTAKRSEAAAAAGKRQEMNTEKKRSARKGEKARAKCGGGMALAGR